MTQFKKGYYQADRQNGVTYVGKILEEDVHVSDPGFFLYTIPYLDHDEILTTFLDESESHRLRTANGGYVFMSWHRIMGPEFYYDRWHNRPINDWWEDSEICAALDWFVNRGYKS